MSDEIDRIARIIDPSAMEQYERDFAKDRGPTLSQISAYPAVKKARQKADEILALLGQTPGA